MVAKDLHIDSELRPRRRMRRTKPEAQGVKGQTNWYVKLGHKWGMHAVGISYGGTDDLGPVGNEDTGFGVGYVYNMPKVNTQLYAGYLHQELSIDRVQNPGLAGVSVEDIDVVLVGGRVQFD